MLAVAQHRQGVVQRAHHVFAGRDTLQPNLLGAMADIWSVWDVSRCSTSGYIRRSAVSGPRRRSRSRDESRRVPEAGTAWRLFARFRKW